MEKVLVWLERRLGRYAAPHVTLAFIIGQVLVYVVQMSQQNGGQVAMNLMLSRDLALAEPWRLITFLFVPPQTNPVFAFFFWYLFYMMGTALEQHWGVFRYNVFLLVGWLATIAAAMLTPLGFANNLFLQGSVFLAFARLYPDFQIMLMFILPVKVKWLALFQWALYALQLVSGPWSVRAMVIASVLNYLLFFAGEHLADFRADARRRSFQKKASSAGRVRHECAVCGRNSEQEPRTAFRYCSQCAGGRCYCPDHLKNHVHVEEA